MREEAFFQKIDNVAKMLNVKEATIRKYQLEIEREHGYRFKRSTKNHLLFSDYDIDMFRRIMYLKSESDMTVSQAIADVMKTVDIIRETPPNTASSTKGEQEGELQVELNANKEFFEMVAQLKEFIVELKESNAKKDEQITLLLEEKSKESKLLEDKLNQRDENLMSLMRDMQEVKKQLAASNEPKGFFAKLFGK
ncbi:DUF3967 domain-containing protein [Priestia aryabhattai]|uniref:DUF3967 domain-containing protein n=1 Tax=Priestia aryabhattai TaxID=412384 RepID=UPI002E2347CE|nr:DUF3967 domain-containing protein [Priestia aryabhattai]